MRKPVAGIGKARAEAAQRGSSYMRPSSRSVAPPQGVGARGVSLVEVVTAMAISAILAGISLPNMLNVIQSYSADGAARQVMADLRYAQTQAISRGMQARLVIFNANGVATGSGYANDATRANTYRLEARLTGGAWPAVSDTPATNANVLTPWQDLAHDYRQGVTQANAVAFTSRGSLQNSAAALTIALQTLPAGRAHTVATNPTGKVTIQ